MLATARRKKERIMYTASSGHALSPAESRVLSLVSARPMRTSELMEEGKRAGLNPSDIREAVWSLVDDGQLAFTADLHVIRA